MRLVAATWVCTLLACSIDNPVFMVESLTESTPAPATTGEPTTGTSATGLTTEATTDATADATTGAPQTSTSTSTTTELTTGSTSGSTSELTDDSGTGDSEGDLCAPQKSAAVPDRHVFNLTTKQDIDVCKDPSSYHGELKVTDGALVITVGQCNALDDTKKFRLGDHFPLKTADGTIFPCVNVKVYWQDDPNDCVFSGMTIHEDPTNKLLFAAGFSDAFAVPFKLEPVEDMCGCPDDEDCCPGTDDPGNYALRVDGNEPVGPGTNGIVGYDGKNMRLHNLQAYVEPDCTKVVDYFAEPG